VTPTFFNPISLIATKFQSQISKKNAHIVLYKFLPRYIATLAYTNIYSGSKNQQYNEGVLHLVIYLCSTIIQRFQNQQYNEGVLHLVIYLCSTKIQRLKRGCCGHDRIVVGFTTTYAISAYHK
jgi:hypothetical protein